nr:hypothetical protein [Tessaracoccus sp. MC1865]
MRFITIHDTMLKSVVPARNRATTNPIVTAPTTTTANNWRHVNPAITFGSIEVSSS